MVEGLERGAVVGRDRELVQLMAASDAAARGEGRTVIVGGEAGIGKSRLVTTLAGVARARGAAVLVGACLPTGIGAIPYAPFVEALRGLTRSVEPERIPALLGPARDEVGRLIPEVATVVARSTDRSESDRTGQGRLFEAILTVLERLARSSTVVLVVEDVQWADAGTRALLGFLSRNLREAPVLILVTVRTDDLDAGDPTLRFIGELERDPWVERIELGPLAQPAIVAMVRSLRPEEAASDRIDLIASRSGGNPFFIEQLATEPGGSARRLPPELHDILAAQLAALPEPTRRILRAAAAAGRRVDDEILAAVLGMPSPAVADALRPALASAILVDADADGNGRGGLAFRHRLLAEVADAELLHGERDRLHAAFALELERRGEIGGVPVTPGELADHWVAARDLDRAIPALIAAGQAAELVYAFAEARHHYDLALELWDRSDDDVQAPIDRIGLLQRAAECAVLTGSYARAVALGREAIVTAEIADVADGRPDAVRLGGLHDRLRWYLWESGDRAAAEAALDAALRIIPVSPPSSTRARALGQAAGLRLFGRDPVEAGRLAREAIDVARAARSPADEAFGLGILGWSEAVTGDVEHGIATYREGLALAERLGGVEGIALGHANLAALLDQVGRSEASLVAARDGFAIAERLGVTRTYGGELLGDAAKALFDLGRWDEAAATADRGLALDPLGPAATWLHVNRARVDTNQGRFDDADRHLQRASELGATGHARYRGALVGAIIELAGARGRLPVVRAAVDGALSTDRETMPRDPALGWLVWHALRAEADAAVAARGRHDEAELATIGARFAAISAQVQSGLGNRGWGEATHSGGVIALCLGEIDRITDTIDPDRWEAIAAGWEGLGRPALTAYARYRLAEAVLGRRGDRAVAAAALRSAHAISRQLEATPLRAEIERLARHARIEIDVEVEELDDRQVDPLGLTPREAEVIRLVAAGRSNQQIADELFITRKTASVHVSNILGKLGVANRVEAAAVAQRLGLHHSPDRSR
ncbi:MAG TPA: AAA family ATPase [Candidatus Limnocylindrales bacterium]|nr:AAA family ATPase [Candidatus Limnocylindrales bacterium]